MKNNKFFDNLSTEEIVSWADFLAEEEKAKKEKTLLSQLAIIERIFCLHHVTKKKMAA